MISITELPFLVTENILKYAASRRQYKYSRHWKSTLPLLAVCSTWRTLTLPTLYQYAFIEVRVDRNVSNIATIKANMCMKHVNNLLIEINNYHLLPIFLENFKSIFQFERYSWLNVSSLSFCIVCNERFTHRLMLDGYYGRPKVLYDHFVESVIKHMPNISRLDLDCKKDPNNLFFDNIVLIDAFQSQLNMLKFYSPIVFDSGLYLSNLTHLSLKLNNETGDILPTINPLPLKHMQLVNVPSDFSWEYFHNGPEITSKVDFASLRSFLIQYSSTVEDGHTDIPDEDREIVHFTVHFPVLESIHIENGVGLPMLNTTYDFNKHIKCITIINAVDGIRTIRNSNIKTVRNINISLHKDELNDEINTDLIEPICNSLDLTRKVNISLHSSQINLEWKDVQWTRLCNLSLEECTSGFFWDISVRCPNIHKFETEEIVILDDENVPVGSYGIIKSSIKQLRIHSLNKSESIQKKQMFVEMIILRFAQFSRVELRDCRWLKHEKLLSGYSHQYPHLDSVQVKHGGACEQECSSHIEIRAGV